MSVLDFAFLRNQRYWFIAVLVVVHSAVCKNENRNEPLRQAHLVPGICRELVRIFGSQNVEPEWDAGSHGTDDLRRGGDESGRDTVPRSILQLGPSTCPAFKLILTTPITSTSSSCTSAQ